MDLIVPGAKDHVSPAHAGMNSPLSGLSLEGSGSARQVPPTSGRFPSFSSLLGFCNTHKHHERLRRSGSVKIDPDMKERLRR